MSKLNDVFAERPHEPLVQAKGVTMLADKIVLIVESEFLIALSMQAALQSHGVTEFVVITNHREALQLRDDWRDADLAIVEVEATRSHQVDLVNAVAGIGIPVIGITADSRLKKGVPELSDTPILAKPVPDEDLIAAVQRLLHPDKA